MRFGFAFCRVSVKRGHCVFSAADIELKNAVQKSAVQIRGTKTHSEIGRVNGPLMWRHQVDAVKYCGISSEPIY